MNDGCSNRASVAFECAGCGYDLRGIAGVGVCPECALPVQTSAGTLALAHRFVPAVRLLSLGYLLMVVPWGLAAQIIVQAVAAYRLRYCAGLEHRQATALAVRVLWWAACVEGAALSILALTVIARQPPMVTQPVGLAMLIAGAVALLTAMHLCVIWGGQLHHEPIVRGTRVLSVVGAIVWLFMLAALSSVGQQPWEWSLVSCASAPAGLLAAIVLRDVAREVRREVTSST